MGSDKVDSAEDVGGGAAYHRPLFLWVVNETCQQDKSDYAEIATMWYTRRHYINGK